ncbi:hypothetical protein KFU94_26835 [Chloroflexi bacterium TSY]|nr:hypothetical protein [Chloroflexi bacterium TSY]
MKTIPSTHLSLRQPEAMLNDPNGLCHWTLASLLSSLSTPRTRASTGDTQSAMI